MRPGIADGRVALAVPGTGLWTEWVVADSEAASPLESQVTRDFVPGERSHGLHIEPIPPLADSVGTRAV